MGRDGTRRRRGVALVTIFAIAALQTLLHLELTLAQLDTIFDLGRSNGVPDLVSTMTLAFASVGATALALRDHGIGRAVAAALAGFLGIPTLADALHDGPHPTRPHGLLVVALAIAAVGMLLMVCRDAPLSMRSIAGASFLALALAFALPALERYDHRFERERGDPIPEYQIVAKEDLEFLGWGFVALALWLEAERRGNRARRYNASFSSTG
jgi:hypothetical protein